MGVISEFKRNAYSGAIADQAVITPADGDTFYATDTDQLFIGHGGSWIHQPRLVILPKAAKDFTLVDFVTNGAWQVDGLDLTGKVPVGTIAVNLRLKVEDDAASSVLSIRQNATTHEINGITAIVSVANISIQAVDFISLDSDRLLDYLGTNLVFTIIDLTVLSYWI